MGAGRPCFSFFFIRVRMQDVVSKMTWQDGTEIDLNALFEPVGYKFLGWANSGKLEYPEGQTYRVYHSSRGHLEHWAIPAAKAWYAVDSS